MLRGQIAIPYVFGGLAKLNGDWLHGQPLVSLPEGTDKNLVGVVGVARHLCRHLHLGWSGDFNHPEPLDGARFIWWNFVSSRRERITAAASEWSAHQTPRIEGETEWIPLPPVPL